MGVAHMYCEVCRAPIRVRVEYDMNCPKCGAVIHDRPFMPENDLLYNDADGVE